LALEVLTHGSHQHGDEHHETLNSLNTLNNLNNSHSGHTDHANHLKTLPATSEVVLDLVPDAKPEHAGHSGEDCICDEICCLSSINIGIADGENSSLSDNQYSESLSDFYLSISIDLLLPPPTR